MLFWVPVLNNFLLLPLLLQRYFRKIWTAFRWLPRFRSPLCPLKGRHLWSLDSQKQALLQRMDMHKLCRHVHNPWSCCGQSRNLLLLLPEPPRSLRKGNLPPLYHILWIKDSWYLLSLFLLLSHLLSALECFRSKDQDFHPRSLLQLSSLTVLLINGSEDHSLQTPGRLVYRRHLPLQQFRLFLQ